MSDNSPLYSEPDSPPSNRGVNERQRKSPDSLTAFESHYANFSAAHHHAMAAQAAQAAMAAAGLAGPSGSGKKSTVNNNMVSKSKEGFGILGSCITGTFKL